LYYVEASTMWKLGALCLPPPPKKKKKSGPNFGYMEQNYKKK